MLAFVRTQPQQSQQELELGQVFARRIITPSALLRKQQALCVCRDFLSRRCDGVHATQAISQRFHHVRCEMRRLLNEEMEPPSIDFRHRQEVFATAVAVRGLSSINATSPISAPGPTVSSTKLPNKTSNSPSNTTYVFSPLSPSRNRESPGASLARRFRDEKAPRDS
jgi:hypothetical protein